MRGMLIFIRISLIPHKCHQGFSYSTLISWGIQLLHSSFIRICSSALFPVVPKTSPVLGFVVLLPLSLSLPLFLSSPLFPLPSTEHSLLIGRGAPKRATTWVRPQRIRPVRGRRRRQQAAKAARVWSDI